MALAPTQHSVDLLEAALGYGARGWPVIPVQPLGKKPHPMLGDDWPSKGSPHEATIRSWWSRDPNANIGIVCNERVGFVLDVDDADAIDFMPDIPETLTARTPSGGRHYVFRHPPGITIDNGNRGIVGWLKSRGYKPGVRGVDIRGARGQIVVAPSVRADGGHYEWVDLSVPIAPAPAWLLEAIRWRPPLRVVSGAPAERRRDLSAYKRAAIDGEARELAATPEGSRGHRAYAAAAALGSLGLSLGETEAELVPACDRNGLVAKDGLNRVRREIARGWEKGHAEPRAEPTEPIGSVPAVRRDEEPPHPADADGGGTVEPVLIGRRRGIEWVKVYPDNHPKRAGQPISCIENTKAMLDHYGARVGFNLMTHREDLDAGPYLDDAAAERRGNAARAQFRMWARKHGISSSKPLDDHLEILIATNPYHPVADWIRSQPWDGVDRIEPLFASLTLDREWARDPANVDHARRVLKAWLVTGAMAAMLPHTAREGIAAQGVLVLQGDQGTGKTRWIMSLVPAGLGWAQESVMIDPASRDSREAATRCWLSELGEIDATFRKADIAALKGMLTQRVDTYRKAYDRAPEEIARRTFFAASVNERNFLADETGSRRFWSLPIAGTNPKHGIDLQQLWAQAAALAEADPDCVWLTEPESQKLREVNAAFDVVDPMWETVARLYEVGDEAAPWLSLDEIKRQVDDSRSWSVSDGRHLARVLKNRLRAPTRVSRGYTQYRIIRRPAEPSDGQSP